MAASLRDIFFSVMKLDMTGCGRALQNNLMFTWFVRDPHFRGRFILCFVGWFMCFSPSCNKAHKSTKTTNEK